MILGNNRLNMLPEVVKNLLIINGLCFLATWSLTTQGIDMFKLFGLHQFQSEDFMPHQLITHMFMHADFTHLLFNMFTLWMFGKLLENMWVSKKFLIYYLITGLGAALIYVAYIQFQILDISSTSPELLDLAKKRRYWPGIIDSEKLTGLVNAPMVGASGAVYGVLRAYGMLFPNTLIYLYFAVPIKSKYFVMGIGALALFSGLGNNPSDNVAHFAHLGGMIFGFLLIKIWKAKNNFY